MSLGTQLLYKSCINTCSLGLFITVKTELTAPKNPRKHSVEENLNLESDKILKPRYRYDFTKSIGTLLMCRGASNSRVEADFPNTTTFVLPILKLRQNLEQYSEHMSKSC